MSGRNSTSTTLTPRGQTRERDAKGRALATARSNSTPAPVGRGASCWQSMRKRLGTIEYQNRLALVRSHIANGDTEHEIAALRDWTPREVRVLIDGLMHEERTIKHGELNRNPEEVYLRFSLQMSRVINDLTKLSDDGRELDPVPLSAMVGATRARADILEKMLKVGQDMGLVHRVPRDHRLIGLLLNMGDRQLQQELRTELGNLKRLMSLGAPWSADGARDALTVDAEVLVESAEKALATDVGGPVAYVEHDPADRVLVGSQRPSRARGGLAKKAGGVRARRMKVTRGPDD